MSLHLLSKETVHLLSSSQVITSVYAVVKELVENSLDAKATSIEVKLENFGLNIIEVRDNGSGIKKEDTANMARPHYTSKLASFDDLQSLDLYGFRGEALASIAAVSSLSITTRTQSDPIATTYTLDQSGNVTSTKHSHLGQGTTVSVANIFTNLPVRKQCFKSAKKCKEELRRVEDVLVAFGLGHCGLRLTLKHNKCIIWQKIQTSDFGSNVSLILGAALFQQLMPVNYQSFSPMVKIRSFVPKYEADLSMVSRATSDKIYLLVNQRCVTVKPLIQLLKRVFSESSPSQCGRYPVAVMMITVPPTDVDVNLEPNKTSVLLQNMDFILTTLESLLTKLYSRSKIGDSEEATNTSTTTSSESIPRKEEEAVQAVCPGHQQKSAISRTIQSHEETPLPRSVAPHFSGLDAATGRDSNTDDTRLQVPVFQRPSFAGNTAAVGVSNSPLHNAVTLDNQGTRSTLESGDNNMTTSKECLVEAQRSSLASRESVAGQDPVLLSECDVSLSHQEMESFELLDVSEFENDNSSESMPPSPPQIGSKSTSPTPADEIAATESSISTFQFHQMSLSQWSRGEGLRDPGGQPIEPVRVLTLAGRSNQGSTGQCSSHSHSLTSKQPSSRSKLNYKGPPPIFDMINSKPVKRRPDTSPSLSVQAKQGGGEATSAKGQTMSCKPLPSLLQKLIHGDGDVTQGAHNEVPCKELSVDLKSISERSSANAVACGDSVAVIGLVDPPGVWLVVFNESIACLNTNPSSSQLQLSTPPTKKEVKQLLVDLLARSRSTGDGNVNPTADSGYLDINNFLHNLTKI